MHQHYLSEPCHFADDGLVVEVVVSSVINALAQKKLKHPSRPVDRQRVALHSSSHRMHRRKQESTYMKSAQALLQMFSGLSDLSRV